MNYQIQIETCLRLKKKLLKDFGIEMTEEIENEIISLFPNEAAIDRYTRRLILKKLEN